MECPYCESGMEEGALISQRVPQWVKKGEKKGTDLPVKKHLSYNEIPSYYCEKCRKIIIDI